MLLNGAACEVGHSCTDIGCGDGVSIVVSPESNVWQEGSYTVELELDGSRRSCNFSIPADLPPTGSVTSLECGLLEQLAECTSVRQGDAVSQSCSPIPNQHRLVLDAQGQPASVTVTLKRDDAVLLSHEDEFRYVETRPNGPDCGPVCRNATVQATFDE